MRFGPIKLGGGKDKGKKEVREKKGFLEESPGRKKEPREMVELKLQAELDMIAERYQNTIVSDDTDTINLGTTRIVSREQPVQTESSSDSAGSLNRLDATQETPHKFTLRRQIGKMRRSADKGDQRMDKVYKDMDEYVPSDLIDRLVRGESVYECLQGESLPQNSDISQMFESMLDGLSDEPVNDNVVEGNIASISDLISELSDD